jgi:hypothetical protein
MSGKQTRNRRHAAKGRIINMNLSEFPDIESLSPDEARANIVWRIKRNMVRTGHPFHHRTGDGTIVDADPTLEHLISTKLTDALPTVPVDRMHYGFDQYADYSGLSEAELDEIRKRVRAALDAHEQTVAERRKRGLVTHDDLPIVVRNYELHERRLPSQRTKRESAQ